MKKKLSIIITALILSILAAGCSVEIHEDSGKQDAKYYLYDISSDETQLQKESYSPEETTADYMLKDTADEQPADRFAEPGQSAS